jgi:hypothetical protein
MSGHSKFANIKHKKEKNDAAKGKVFTIIGREIAVAVKEGGPDPANNYKLAQIIAKAKSNNMPNDTIERGIKKASGELGNVNYEYTTEEINKLHISSGPNYNKYFSDMNEEKFLHLLLIKRKAFKYESEIRLFVLPEHREHIYTHEGMQVIMHINFCKEQLEKMIKSISIDPSCSDIECDMIKTKIGQLFPNIKCDKNGLYNIKPRLIIK